MARPTVIATANRASLSPPPPVFDHVPGDEEDDDEPRDGERDVRVVVRENLFGAVAVVCGEIAFEGETNGASDRDRHGESCEPQPPASCF